jgi:Ca-activated chloride channel family protein
MAFAAMSHMLDELFVVNFNERVWLGLAPSVAFTEDMDDIRAALADTPAQGMSALYEAVDRALDHLQLGVHDRKALIVVSDGGDNASVRTLDAVLDHARRTQAVIYAVAPFDPDNREAKPAALKMLARETGGRAFLARRSDDVTRSFTEIAKELRSGYTIGFEPPEPTAHAFRPIRVIVNAGGTRSLVARTRAGYYAEPSGRTVR